MFFHGGNDSGLEQPTVRAHHWKRWRSIPSPGLLSFPSPGRVLFLPPPGLLSIPSPGWILFFPPGRRKFLLSCLLPLLKFLIGHTDRNRQEDLEFDFGLASLHPPSPTFHVYSHGVMNELKLIHSILCSPGRSGQSTFRVKVGCPRHI